MSYRLEDLYHYAVTNEVTEEQARLAAERAVRQELETFEKKADNFSLVSIFTAGCCAGRTIKRKINEQIEILKQHGKDTVQD
jgi:predicted metal-binding protein